MKREFDVKGIWKGFTDNWRRRNWITDIILYGIQVTAVVDVLIMVLEIIGVVCDFYSAHPLGLYEEMTVSCLFYNILCKGWLVGFLVCIIVFFGNRRVIKWKADGVLWMFIIFFGVSILTFAVEAEMFIYYSVISMGALALYSLSLFLPKRIGDANKTTFQQCRKPSNWLITFSFIVLVLWSIYLFDTICRF